MAKAQTEVLAAAFSRIVRGVLANHLEEINQRNRKYEQEGDLGSCATHEFCDASMLMAQAWKETTGREPDVSNEDDAAVWGEAWAMAAFNRFGGNDE